MPASSGDAPTPASPPRLTRRALLRRASWAAAGGLAAGAGVTLLGERHRPRVYRVTARVPGLPEGLRGLTICQLSDFHRGPLVSEAYLRGAAEVANSLRPDLTVVTGDFVSDTNRYAESCAAALAGLRARHGVYGVLGNHDYWTEDVEGVAAPLAAAGIRILTNASARITTAGTDWWLCGVDDMWAGRPDLDRTLDGVPPGAFRLLLSHAPDFADEAAARGFLLQLSGHSHGGQILLPGCRPIIGPRFGRRYPMGLQEVADSRSLVYTNVGLGVTAVPIRLNCPPEVTLLRLETA